ncbi:adenosylcobinamide-phosphate synthase [Alteromonas sp. KUL49]|nr:adenosylcobinamide-phosphate synthase [Alteromonas sp. KUL49]
MRYLVKQMGKKVLPSTDYGPSQHYISGALAGLVLLSPLVVCLGILIYMAEYPIFFEGILLVALLDFGYQRRQYKKVLSTVGKNKKVLTREWVAKLVARDCSTLTDVGVAKAAIESLWLKFVYLFCGVLLYFVLFGPIVALIYRLVLLTSWEWHYRDPKMRYFSRPARLLCSLFLWLPTLFAGLVLMLVSNPLNTIKSAIQSPAKDRTSRLLAMFGNALDIQLGGPAIYHSIKYRYPRVGGSKQVKFSDMVYSYQRISSAMAVAVALFSILLIAVSQPT